MIPTHKAEALGGSLFTDSQDLAEYLSRCELPFPVEEYTGVITIECQDQTGEGLEIYGCRASKPHRNDAPYEYLGFHLPDEPKPLAPAIEKDSEHLWCVDVTACPTVSINAPDLDEPDAWDIEDEGEGEIEDADV